jgi:hypothetical protein
MTMGIVTAGMAQDDSASQNPTFNCKYVDGSNLQCDLDDEGKNKDRENVKDELNIKNSSRKDQSEESKENNAELEEIPEVESDEGIMDNSCMIDSNVIEPSVNKGPGSDAIKSE